MIQVTRAGTDTSRGKIFSWGTVLDTIKGIISDAGNAGSYTGTDAGIDTGNKERTNITLTDD